MCFHKAAERKCSYMARSLLTAGPFTGWAQPLLLLLLRPDSWNLWSICHFSSADGAGIRDPGPGWPLTHTRLCSSALNQWNQCKQAGGSQPVRGLLLHPLKRKLASFPPSSDSRGVGSPHPKQLRNTVIDHPFYTWITNTMIMTSTKLETDPDLLADVFFPFLCWKRVKMWVDERMHQNLGDK